MVCSAQEFESFLRMYCKNLTNSKHMDELVLKTNSFHNSKNFMLNCFERFAVFQEPFLNFSNDFQIIVRYLNINSRVINTCRIPFWSFLLHYYQFI